VRNGARRELKRVKAHSVGILGFDINLEWPALGENFMLTRGELL
jgi:hypothetical protein